MTDRTGAHSATDANEAGTRPGGGDGVFAHLGRATRVLLLFAGVTTLGVGLLVVFDPETEGALRIDAAIEALGSDYVVLAVLGLLAVGLALLLVAARRVRGVSEATPPAVEGVLTATYPGASFDRAGDGRLSRFLSGRSENERRDRLRDAAIRATMRADGCSRTDAERRVDEGTWTSDPVAASNLAASRHSGLRGTLHTWRGSRNADPADRTVDAIAAKTTGESSASRDGGRAVSGDPDDDSVRNPGRNPDRSSDGNSDGNPDTDSDPDSDPESDANQDAARAANRRPDERSTTQEGLQ